MKSKYISLLCILTICLFMPFEARADGISIPILLGGGFIVFAPIILFISLLETAVMFKPLKWSFGYGFKIMLIANVFSMLSGIPVKIINTIFYSYTMPSEIYEFFRIYPYLVAVGTLFYFVVTLVVEYLYLRHVSKREAHKKKLKKLAVWLIIANLISYSLMAPLNYYVTRPQHDIEEFTSNSSWAQKPASPIYYIDSNTKYLAMIMSDGTNRKIIGKKPEHVFHIDNDGKRYYSQKQCPYDDNGTTKVIVYWGLGSSIWVKHKGENIVFAINPGLLHLGTRWWHAALLPNGKEVVFCDSDNIYLMDIEKKRIGKIISGSNFVLLTPLFQKPPRE